MRCSFALIGSRAAYRVCAVGFKGVIPESLGIRIKSFIRQGASTGVHPFGANTDGSDLFMG